MSILLTDDAPEIAGTARDAKGKPVHDCTVIAFSADRRFWFPQSRRIVVRQSGEDGLFVFGLAAGLPPGEYYVAALPDLGPGEQFDSVLLGELAKTAETREAGRRRQQDRQRASGHRAGPAVAVARSLIARIPASENVVM